MAKVSPSPTVHCHHVLSCHLDEVQTSREGFTVCYQVGHLPWPPARGGLFLSYPLADGASRLLAPPLRVVGSWLPLTEAW